MAKFVPNDHFGSREAGEAAAFDHASIDYREEFYQAVGELIRQPGRVSATTGITSQDITDMIGMPQDADDMHPSTVGALMTPAAKAWGLVAIGTTKARGRHQQWNTLWGLPT